MWEFPLFQLFPSINCLFLVIPFSDSSFFTLILRVFVFNVKDTLSLSLNLSLAQVKLFVSCVKFVTHVLKYLYFEFGANASNGGRCARGNAFLITRKPYKKSLK